MELSMISAGQIVNTHGIRGEVKLLPRQQVLAGAVLGDHVPPAEGGLDAVLQLFHVAAQQPQGRRGPVPHGGGDHPQVHAPAGAGDGPGLQVVDVRKDLRHV